MIDDCHDDDRWSDAEIAWLLDEGSAAEQGAAMVQAARRATVRAHGQTPAEVVSAARAEYTAITGPFGPLDVDLERAHHELLDDLHWLEVMVCAAGTALPRLAVALTIAALRAPQGTARGDAFTAVLDTLRLRFL